MEWGRGEPLGRQAALSSRVHGLGGPVGEGPGGTQGSSAVDGTRLGGRPGKGARWDEDHRDTLWCLVAAELWGPRPEPGENQEVVCF